MTDRPPRHSRNGDAMPLEEQLKQIARLEPAKLLEYASQLLMQHAELQQVTKAVREEHQELRAQIESITCPEHFPGTITAVDLSATGPPTVEVYGVGATRMRLGVHSDVAVESLQIGATAIVANTRNCVLRVITGTPAFRDIGTLEEQHGEFLLVKEQERLLRLRATAELLNFDLHAGDRIGYDRDSGIAFMRLPSPDQERYFETEYPADDFTELGGLDAVIAKIRRVLEFQLAYPDLASQYRLKPQNILLVGPPGNGKTKLARCCAALIGQLSGGKSCRFLCVAGSVYSPWFGQSESEIRNRFAAARQATADGPVLMYFDEIDAMSRVRGADHGSTAPDRVLNTVLSELDGVRKSPGLIVMASTNRADVLDPAITRAGRFDLKLQIGAPTRAGARAILKNYLSRLPLAVSAAPSLDHMIEAILSRIFSLNGPNASLATIRLSDARTFDVPGRSLISGAGLEGVVQRAAEGAAWRVAHGGAAGITVTDLTLAVDDELRQMARLLSPNNAKVYLPQLVPQDSHVVSVQYHAEPPAAA